MTELLQRSRIERAQELDVVVGWGAKSGLVKPVR